MEIYNYHHLTGEFIGSGTADKDPLNEGSWLIPDFSTVEPSLNTAENEVSVFNGISWDLKPDFRGVEFWLADGSRHVIGSISETAPIESLTSQPAPTPEQQVSIDKAAALTEYEVSVKTLIGDTSMTEVASWAKQEAQARAYLVDDSDQVNPVVDDTAPTILLDRLTISRAQSETKLTLARKIITNAEAYEVAYADILGLLQSKLKALI